MSDSGDRRTEDDIRNEGEPETSSAPSQSSEGNSLAPTATSGKSWVERSPAEWVSLSISLAIVLGLVAVILFLYSSGRSDEPTIDVQPDFDQVRQDAGDYYLPVTIANTGDVTAEEVMVEVSFTGSEGTRETSEVTIRFLAGNATEESVVVFSGDPRDGDVSTDVISYIMP